MFSTFASIGLSTLIPAIHLRQNTKEYVPVQHLDESATGCYSCPHYLTKTGCDHCEKRQYYTETKVQYINEGHRYGKRKPLKKYALLLYMYLHFLEPDEHGFVSKIDSEETAGALGCSQRTIMNNLDLLCKAGYITYAKLSIPGYYQAFITDYDSIFKTAKQGGRGFLRIGAEFISRICALPDINSIRLAVRSYINNLDYSTRAKMDKEKSIKEIKSQLPEYVTKKKLLDTLQDPVFRSMFQVSTKTRSATIIVLPEFDQAKIAEQVRGACKKEVSGLIDVINKEARATSRASKLPSIRLTDKEMTDIANISLKFPLHSILKAVRHFYQTYIVRNLPYESAGAIVRAFASDDAEYGIISA